MLQTTDRWKNKAGDTHQRHERHSIAVFYDNLVKTIEAHVDQGTTIYLEGQIESRSYIDGQGISRTATDVVLRPSKSQIILMDGATGQEAIKHPSFGLEI